jgi:hypothetical protein
VHAEIQHADDFVSGLKIVPPKLFGLWKIIILLFAVAAKVNVSISSTRDHNFSCKDLALRMLLKVAMFLLPSSLLGWLLNHSGELIFGNMLL